MAIQSRGWGQISAWDMASSSVREGVLPPIDDPAGLRAFGPHSIEAGADAPYTNFSSGCLVRGTSSEVPPLSPSSGTPAVSDDSLSASSTCAPLKLRQAAQIDMIAEHIRDVRDAQRAKVRRPAEVA